jgi:hypothetical protein
VRRYLTHALRFNLTAKNIKAKLETIKPVDGSDTDTGDTADTFNEGINLLEIIPSVISIPYANPLIEPAHVSVPRQLVDIIVPMHPQKKYQHLDLVHRLNSR